MGISHSLFEQELQSLKAANGVTLDTDLTADDLKQLVVKYKDVYKQATGKQFPAGIVKNRSSSLVIMKKLGEVVFPYLKIFGRAINCI